MTQRQEVNLYLPELRPTVDYLSTTMVARGAVALLMLLLAVACFDLYQNYRLQQDIAERSETVENLKQQIAEVKKQLPKSQGAKLDREIRNLGVEIKRREAISRLIDGQSIGNTHGFSEQLLALGENASAKIALTAFELTAGGDVVSLSGRTRIAESVPSYIDRLRQTDSFSSSVFGPMSIARSQEPSILTFSLNRDLDQGEESE